MANLLPHILVVEDNPDDQELSRLALKKLGQRCVATFVDDGVAAIEYLDRASADGAEGSIRRPDLMLIDLSMPRMDGLELMERLRDTDPWRRIPIVVFTTSTAERDVAACYESGCNSYIVKPYSMNELTKVLDELLVYWFERVRLPIC